MAIKQMLRWIGSDKSYSIKFVSVSQHSSYFVAAAVFGVDQPTFDMKTRTIRYLSYRRPEQQGTKNGALGDIR